jgi:hypothetical protein
VIEILLAGAIIPLAALAWASAVVLIVASHRRPNIGALTERAAVAVGIALFGTIYSIVVLNNDVWRIFDTGAAVVVVRLAVVGLLTLPAAWSFAYITGRLGDDGKGGPA